MNYTQLQELIDSDTLTSKLNPENGIVALHFAVNGVLFTAQYSTNHTGIYAFSLGDDSQAEQMLKTLKEN